MRLAKSFGTRLSEGFQRRGQLCVGIDPHPAVLEEWGLADSAAGVREFSTIVLEAAVDQVAVVKPQVAFFERFGSEGFSVLERVIEAARSAGLLVIADAKRGDIGSTMKAYTDAWLSREAPLRADALTVNPYLGLSGLEECFAMAIENAAGVFCLVATSNPEGRELQQAKLTNENASVANDIYARLDKINRASHPEPSPIGSIGAVIGATVTLDDYGLQGLRGDAGSLTPILAPGFGFQGAELKSLERIFGAAAGRVACSMSRELYGAGPRGVEAAVSRAVTELGGSKY